MISLDKYIAVTSYKEGCDITKRERIYIQIDKD